MKRVNPRVLTPRERMDHHRSSRFPYQLYSGLQRYTQPIVLTSLNGTSHLEIEMYCILFIWFLLVLYLVSLRL